MLMRYKGARQWQSIKLICNIDNGQSLEAFMLGSDVDKAMFQKY